MRSLTTLAAAAALMLPLTFAAPEPDTVQLSFNKRKVQATPDKLARRQKANTVNSAISNEYNMYLINVTVGTPPQQIGLQLDTGSSDIWFPAVSSTICREGGCIYGSYNYSASSTYSNPGLGPFEIDYVDGTHIVGAYISDTLVIGGTTLTNLTMADATQPGSEQNGIMGIAFSSGESAAEQGEFQYPNIIDVLLSEGKIKHRAYSLWLDDLQSNTGSILFGGVDKSKYTGNLISIPMQKDAQSGNYTSFTVAWTGFSVSSAGQTYNENPATALPVILDSGTTLTYLPNNIANNIFNGVGVVTDKTWGNIVPCDLANDNMVFSYQFGGSSGPTVNVSIAELVIGPITTNSGRTVKFTSGQYKGKTACEFGIDAAGSNPILFGDTFLRSAYVVYDLDNRQIGLAQTNQNSNTNEDDVAVYSSGTIMPDATTTVTAVTVSGSGDASISITRYSATATTDVGQDSNNRTPTFSLASGTASSTGSKSAAAATIPSIERSTFAVIGATIAAFIFGATLL